MYQCILLQITNMAIYRLQWLYITVEQYIQYVPIQINTYESYKYLIIRTVYTISYKYLIIRTVYTVCSMHTNINEPLNCDTYQGMSSQVGKDRTGCRRSPVQTLPYHLLYSHAGVALVVWTRSLGCCSSTAVVIKATAKLVFYQFLHVFQYIPIHTNICNTYLNNTY